MSITSLNSVTETFSWTWKQIEQRSSLSVSIGISIAAYILNCSAKTSALLGILTFTFLQITRPNIQSKRASKTAEVRLKQTYSNPDTPFVEFPTRTTPKTAPPMSNPRGYTYFSGPNTGNITPEQKQRLRDFIYHEIMLDEDYIRAVVKAGLSREIAVSVYPSVSNVSGFTVYYQDKAYHLKGMTDNLRSKIKQMFG